MPDSATERHAISVLICDDSDSLRLLLNVTVSLDPDLRVAGEARNGVEAITQAAQSQPDVILLDLSMPVLNGLEALPQIKVAAPGTRVIVFTGLPSSIIQRAAMDAGADCFLEKIVEPSAISDAIKSVYRAGQRERLQSGAAN